MAALLAQSPVHKGSIDLGAGASESFGPVIPVSVFGFDECVQVLRDNETFSSTIYEGIMGMVMGRTILQMDEPEHRMQRALVSPAFRSKMLEKWEEGIVRTVVDELIDGFAGRGHADLVREFTFNFPVQVIAHILGLPRRDYPKFQRWAVEITSVAANWDRGVAASEALRDVLRRGAGRAPGQPHRRPHHRARQRGGGRARSSPTRRSTPSSACCCRPGWRPPTGPRATCCWPCSPTPTSWPPCARTARCSSRPSRSRCAGSRR